MRRHLIKRALRAERGFTTVVVMMVILLGGLLVAAAFAASDGDTSITRKDQYYKQAYAAAEAGVNYYLSHLAQNTNYWANCYTAPIQAPGTAYSTSTSQAIPGSEGRYEIELLKAPNYTGACSATVTSSVIDPSSGQLSIRSTGYYRGVRRSIVATFKRQGFLNYLWFTDYETPDPLTYADPTTAQAKCAMYYRDGRDTSYCRDQSFITGDGVDGPAHTNDEFLMCGTPAFGRTNNGNVDKIEASDPNGWRSSCSANPTFNGVTKWGASNLQLPTSNSAIKSYANSNWIFTGPVHITLSGSTATVKNSAGTTLRTGTITNGVIYVQNGTCSTSFAASQQYPSGGGCGDAWVSSSSQVTSDVTIAAENDVIIAGNLTHNGSSVIGLIANDFVRVYHPVQYSYGSCDQNSANITPTSGEGNGIAYLQDPQIQAAILSLNHSFWVDNYGCGSALGSLHVTGAIAQKFRGTVGTHSNGVGVTGYLKDYNYDSALRYHQPPYFLDPVQASWDIFSQTEQVPAH